MVAFDNGPLARDQAIVLVTDRGFLWPTLAVVSQLAEMNPKEPFDIVVFLVGDVKDHHIPISQAFGRYDILFLPFPDDLIGLGTDIFFNKTHVPPSTLARGIICGATDSEDILGTQLLLFRSSRETSRFD